jgi:cytochrome c2
MKTDFERPDRHRRLAAASGALAQDAAAGKTSFNKCLACHAVGEGAKNKVGPMLNGLDGRKSGTAEGYSYSEANKNSGITWNKDQFLDYIKDPKAKIPAPRWCSPASRTRRRPTTSGRSSRNTTRTARPSSRPGLQTKSRKQPHAK